MLKPAAVFALVAGFFLAAASAFSEGARVAEPDDYRLDDYRSPVPQTLRGARVVSTEEAEELWRRGEAVFIDVYPRAPKPPDLPAGTVWRDIPHLTLKGAHWLPNVGYGVLSPDVETHFKTSLANLTGNARGKTVVFLCQRDCWMSWNAAKRAVSWSYENVVWFPDGTDGWLEMGRDLFRVEPVR